MAASEALQRSPTRALLSAMRPRQWVKNGLIVVAPAASGRLLHGDVARHTISAFVAFCFVASAIYLLNDLRDAEADRAHPTKRYRAIAAHQLSTTTATVTAILLLVIGFLVPLSVPHPGDLLVVLALYVVITLAYVYWLKHVVIIELGAVASGFFLRAYAGASASHLYVSSWFLLVVSFGALFLVVGKRASELKTVGVGSTRGVLSEYTSDFLSSALTLCATAVVTAYCLWAFDTARTGLSANLDATLPVRLSVVPVVFALLFILRSAQEGHGAAPEELLLRNRTVQLLLLAWVVLMIFGVYE